MLVDLEKMIKTFNDLHLANAKMEQTFMQLTDYPHLENVCSNVLAFFFDTEETHGFDSLFIKSLLECVGKNANCRSTETVEREVVTDKGNRIDLFIETDKHMIAIENKVFSGLHNPLSDYEAYLFKRNADGDKEPIFVLLTLKEESAGQSAFINVTYSKLFSAIRKNLGAYVVTANTKWIVILNDFIRTIEELQGGAVLNREFIDFYNEHVETIAYLLDAKRNLPISMKAKLRSIVSLAQLNELASDISYYQSAKDNCYAECFLKCKNIKQIDAPVYCTVYIDTKACVIGIGIDEATGSRINALKKFLNESKVKFSQWEDYDDYLLIKKLDVFEADEVIAKELQNVLCSLV